jgi:PAS domain S-box-containing protein
MSAPKQYPGQTPTDSEELRKRAEEKAEAMEPISLSGQPPEAIEHTLHELRVHQIELELQNEELRSAKEEIEKSQERYFNLYDLAPVGYCTLSEQGMILEANLTAAVLLDTARSALVKQPISRFILKEDQDIYYQHRKKLFETGEIQEWELRLLKADGSVFWVHLTATATQAKDGAPVCRVVISDITDRKRAEEERKKLQTQLFQAQKMESIGMLAGGIAHDFNNLLHAMGGNLQLLGKGKPDDHPDKKRIKTIQKSIDRAAHLVRQMLLFSRKADIQRQDLNLNREIRDVRNILERTVPKMISIELILDENARPINADPIQVEQVLLNLGANSADAMPDGGRLIIETANAALDQDFVRTHPGAKPGKYVLMTVSDTGTGMDKETLQHVFEPFFTTKEVGKGTGLGLPTVYGIVKAHGGNITCYSEPGQGTTFKIYWPAAEQGKIEPVEKQTVQAVSQDGTETILVVDDDDQIRELTSEVLEDSGYQVISASSGEQALEVFRKKYRDIDLVLMDLNMPGMGGSLCTRKMITLDPSVRVLVASGYSINGHGKAALEFGAKDFISKPFQPDQLRAKIRKVLDRE